MCFWFEFVVFDCLRVICCVLSFYGDDCWFVLCFVIFVACFFFCFRCVLSVVFGVVLLCWCCVFMLNSLCLFVCVCFVLRCCVLVCCMLYCVVCVVCDVLCCVVCVVCFFCLCVCVLFLLICPIRVLVLGFKFELLFLLFVIDCFWLYCCCCAHLV